VTTPVTARKGGGRKKHRPDACAFLIL